jgi:predicted ATPase/DNA-binding XRE family transcriptional regulator/Tfp pilus assembly protein PilF
MDPDIPFPTWLRQRRKALDLTQFDLAERIGCSETTVRKLELGERRPSRQIAELLVDILRLPEQDRAAFVSFARGHTPIDQPLKPAARGATNLPTYLTPLVGREGEIEAVQHLLTRADTRLLTLTGAPGIGKTSLAVSVASDLAGQFPDGVFFVALAPVSDPNMVLGAIAQALGAREVGSMHLLDVLTRALSHKRALLVLDNFEQVSDAGPSIARLAGGCPGLSILVTSREALRVHGEQQFPVPPLALPEVGALRDAPLRPEVLALNPSIQLFLQRARAVKPGFQLTEENAGADVLRAVAAICLRLEGLPLAIELAAARVRLLSPHEILARLDNRLDLLTGGPRDLPPRQQTLHGAIDWSFNLLGAAEQRLFVRLGVFVGGGTLRAIEAICNARSDLGVGVLDGVDSLVGKSLLKQEETEVGESRFPMLEMIREYALEHLAASGEEEALRQLHAEYYLALAQACGQEMWRGGKQKLWLETLEQEHDNMRGALQWSLQKNDVELALRLAAALAPFWDLRGHLSEGRRWLAAALALAEAHESAGQPGEPGEKQADDSWSSAVAEALIAAGRLAMRQADFAGARSLLERSLAIAGQRGDVQIVAHALLWQGNAAQNAGDFAAAVALTERSLELLRNLDDQWATSHALCVLGYAVYEQGDFDRAQQLFEESKALSEEVGDVWGLARTTSGLGSLAYAQGNFAAARVSFEQALALRRELKSKVGIAYSLNNLGCALVRLGDYEGAAAAAREGLALDIELGEDGNIAWDLAIFGAVAAARGDPVRGARLLGAAEAIHGDIYVSLGKESSAYERFVETARAQLDEEVFASARAQGQAMTVDQAVSYAMASPQKPEASYQPSATSRRGASRSAPTGIRNSRSPGNN